MYNVRGVSWMFFGLGQYFISYTGMFFGGGEGGGFRWVCTDGSCFCVVWCGTWGHFEANDLQSRRGVSYCWTYKRRHQGDTRSLVVTVCVGVCSILCAASRVPDTALPPLSQSQLQSTPCQLYVRPRSADEHFFSVEFDFCQRVAHCSIILHGVSSPFAPWSHARRS